MIPNDGEFYIDGKPGSNFGALLLADCSAGSVSLTRGRVVPSVGQRFTPGATRYGLRPITLPVDIFGSSPEDVHRRKSALDAALLADPVELYLPSGFAYTASLESISDPTELDVEGTMLEVTYTLSGFAHTPLETILVQAGTPLPDPDPGGEEPPPAGTLSSLAVGSVIQLAENGTAADYYVAAHNYESGLNGTGRTLVVRKDCLSAMAWNRAYLNAYAQSTVDTWLTSVFLARFATDVRAAIGSTRFCYMPGSQDTTVTTLQRSVFLLSLAELGLTFSDTPADGTALAIAGKLTGAEWTRTPLPSGTTAVLRRNEAGSCEIDICTTQLPIRPAFTLPSTFAVDSTQVQTAAEAVPQAAQEPASAEVYSFFITGTAPAMECALTVTVPENAGTVFTVSYPYQAGSTAQDACTVSGVKTGDVLCVDGIHRTLTVNGTSWLAYTDYFTRWPTVAPGENRILQKASAITLEYYPVYL